MLSSFQSAQAALPLPAQQGGSSFRMALRLLPASQRAALERWRDRIDACYAGMPPPAMQDMAHHIADFGLARTDFHALIDGMLMDAQDHPLCAPAASTLDVYCDRVASAVGRLSVRVFGLPGPDGERLAHHLGRALQLTNILRDIDEDAAIGRAYLPRALLLQAGVEAAACAGVAAQALDHYHAAHTFLGRNRGAAVRAPRLMGATYRRLLARLARRGWHSPRAAVRLGTLERIGILLRHGMG